MTVNTQFGVHLVEVLERGRETKKVKVAYMSRSVEPSSETYQNKYAEAVKFAGVNNTYEQFNSSISEQNLTKRYASNITEAQRTITGLENPRALIRWAFEADLYDVSNEIFEFGNKYVIAVVTGVREKGPAPLEQVRTEVELEVEKNVKANLLAEEFSVHLENVQSIYELGEAMGLIVQEADNITFTSISLPSAGIEPNVISAASVLEQDRLSEPVQGNNGVYVIVVEAVQENGEFDIASLRSRMTIMRESEANFEAFEALKDASEIIDNRSDFF
jgi:peptidyl-prolyl cis-trans isomerase D